MWNTLIFTLKWSTEFYTELSTPCNFIFPDSFYAAGVACHCCLAVARRPGEGASSSHLQQEGSLSVGPGSTRWGRGRAKSSVLVLGPTLPNTAGGEQVHVEK